MVLPATPRSVAEDVIYHGWRTARLRASSPYLLNYNSTPLGNPITEGEPSVRQLFPSTAATLLQALGSPAGNVLNIYLCDTASPLVDSLGAGSNLVAVNAPLTGREGVGLPDTSFVSKLAVETTTAGQAFEEVVASAMWRVAAGGTLAVGCVWRLRHNSPAGDYRVLQKENGWTTTRWYLAISTTYLRAHVTTVASGGVNSDLVAVVPVDGGWHVAVINLVAGQLYLRSDLGTSAPAAYVGAIADAGMLAGICHPGASPLVQAAYVFALDFEYTAAAHTAFWRAFNPAGLGTPNTYTRANPLVVPIAASRVACYGAGQLAVGYSAGLVSAALGNALGTGVVAEDGRSFDPIGSADALGTTTDQGTNTHSSVDGASGMRDGVRALQGAGAAWAPAGNACLLRVWTPIVGASNVPFLFGGAYRQATVGTAARLGAYFSGDAGGAEAFTAISDNAVPADWRFGQGIVTPTRAGHVQYFIAYGANVAGENCDWSEFFAVYNQPVNVLAWRRVGTAATATTSTPTLSYTNANNARYNPARGSLEVIISGFQGTNGATFLQFGAAAAAGSLTLDYAAGQLRLRMWNAAAGLALTVNGGALTSARHRLTIGWESLLGASLIEGSTILGTWAGAWTPAPGAVTPLYVGSDATGANAARCVVELVAWRSK